MSDTWSLRKILRIPHIRRLTTGCKLISQFVREYKGGSLATTLKCMG